MAEALMRGYRAALVDGSYIEVNGHRVLVQAAAKGAWQIADIDDYTSGTIEHIILVDLTNDQREFYICPGDALRGDVRERYDQFLASHGGSRPRTPGSKHSAIQAFSAPYEVGQPGVFEDDGVFFIPLAIPHYSGLHEVTENLRSQLEGVISRLDAVIPIGEEPTPCEPELSDDPGDVDAEDA